MFAGAKNYDYNAKVFCVVCASFVLRFFYSGYIDVLARGRGQKSFLLSKNYLPKVHTFDVILLFSDIRGKITISSMRNLHCYKFALCTICPQYY